MINSRRKFTVLRRSRTSIFRKFSDKRCLNVQAQLNEKFLQIVGNFYRISRCNDCENVLNSGKIDHSSRKAEKKLGTLWLLPNEIVSCSYLKYRTNSSQRTLISLMNVSSNEIYNKRAQYGQIL